MFYYPDKIVMVVESSDVAARFNGASARCILNANIPCSIDFKRRASGELNRRVLSDALVVVPHSPAHERLFMIGARFVVRRLKGVFWEVVDISTQEGVFNSAQVYEMKCVRKPGELAVAGVGSGSVQHELAARRAALQRPNEPGGGGQ